MEWMTGTAPEHICALLRKGCEGSVEMVNSRGIYLQLEGRHILLCHSRFGTVPNGVSLEQWDRLPSLLQPGQPVWVENGILCFPSVASELRLRSVPKDTQIRFPDEKGLSAGINALLANTKQTGLSSLVYPLFAGERRSMNLYCDTALPYVRGLLQALQEENTEGIRESACALLGLGPGLTPSGDDLLSGLLYGLRHSVARGTAGCETLGDAIRETAPERTNAVSAEYLTAIADDAAFDRMAAAWIDPAANAPGLMEIGNNSGGEMLLGLLLAALVHKKTDPAKSRI